MTATYRVGPRQAPSPEIEAAAEKLRDAITACYRSMDAGQDPPRQVTLDVRGCRHALVALLYARDGADFDPTACGVDLITGRID